MEKPNKTDKKYWNSGNIKSINHERFAFDLEKYVEHLNENKSINKNELRKILIGKCISDESCEAAMNEISNSIKMIEKFESTDVICQGDGCQSKATNIECDECYCS